MSVKTQKFGTTKKGEKATLYTITNKKGNSASITDFGATLVSFCMKDKNGATKDLILGFDDVKPYGKYGDNFGATVGPIANRTAGAKFILNGKEYRLKANDGENNLHTHPKKGFQKRMFHGKPGENSVTFVIEKKDLSMGHPGNIKTEVTYTLTDEDELRIHYHATSDKDTYINLTNHSYFNLNGHASGNIFHERLQIRAKYYTPVAKGAIPTGEIAPVAETPMDFTEAKEVCRDFTYNFPQIELVNGYDHNFVIDDYDGTLKECAAVYDDASGICMQVFTDLPGVQFYTGNWVGVPEAKGGASYGPRQGLCLETQHCPDDPNHSNFPGTTVLRPGEVYDTTTIYAFRVDG